METYSTYLFTQRAIEIINTHNIDEVCAVKKTKYTVSEVVFKIDSFSDIKLSGNLECNPN